MSISLEIGERLQLSVDEKEALYIAVYLVDIGDRTKTGVIVSSSIKVLNNLAQFEFSVPEKFTKVSFQLAKIDMPIEVPKIVDSSKKNKTLREKKKEAKELVQKDENLTSVSDVPVVSDASETSSVTEVAATPISSEEADTSPPTDPFITIAAGAAGISSSTIDLTLAAKGAAEMYITNTSGCTTGGSWEAFATNKSAWTLAQSNDVVTVYIKYRDTANNESACVIDTIVHDNNPPSEPSSIDDGVSTNSASSSPILTWTASSDAGSGISGYQLSIGSTAGASDIKDWTDVGDQVTSFFNNLSLTWGTSYFANVRSVDKALNNSSSKGSDGFLYGFVQEAYLKATNVDSGDAYGVSVAIS